MCDASIPQDSLAPRLGLLSPSQRQAKASRLHSQPLVAAPSIALGPCLPTRSPAAR
jgi:hypothetical protein